MDWVLASNDGILFILRWLHFFFGIMWIGHLYYFNFTQMPFMGETDAATKSNVIQKLVPRALWWFRWGAMFTIITGWLYLGIKGGQLGGDMMLASSWGISILSGALLGTLMWANVWFVIWPNQKIVIQSATQAGQGQTALPNAAAAGARAGVVSRTNTLLSVPMLFFMGAASHLPMQVNATSNISAYWITLAVIIAAIEANALKGKMIAPLSSVKGVIYGGFGLAIILYVAMEILL